MLSEVERVVENDEDKIEVIEGPKDNAEKEAGVTQIVVPMPRPPPPFPQRLVKKTEEGKYHRSMKQESDLKAVSMVNHIVEQDSEVSIEERLGVDILAAVIMNFDSDGIEDYDELVAALDRLGIIQSGTFQQNTEPRETLLMWLTHHIADDGRMLSGFGLLAWHMKPWMQRFITESEVRMEHMMDQKIEAVHKRLDAFEMRVLEGPPVPTIDVTTFQQELATLCADVAALLGPLETEPESSATAVEDNVLLTTLFDNVIPPPNSSCAAGKRHRSILTSDDAKVQRLRKNECQHLDKSTRMSLLDAERRQQRAREIGIGPSGSVNTTGGATFVDVGATDGVPTIDPAGSGKPDPPSS
uniref:Integrase core domain containing protein n=1 Tax=Solanum tuberosum TaxID=4113 RepID=M1DFB2_SOLTU